MDPSPTSSTTSTAPRAHTAHRAWLACALAAALIAPVAGCKKKDSTSDDPGAAQAPPVKPGAKLVELSFVYGSEKKAWLNDAIERFNRDQAENDDVAIRITGEAMGSGVAVDEIAAGTTKPHLWSPASDIFRPRLDAAWTAAQGAVGGESSIAADSKPLVLSPVVIMMWKPMAEAMGWPDTLIGWSDVLAMSTAKQGWASKGHPEWGLFKLGHTHPGFSNSGLQSVLAEAYAGAGTTKELTTEQLDDPKVRSFIQKIESSIVHYGKSTGFFARKMLERGPGYLSAAVVYENLVIDSYKRPEFANRAFDTVAIYPKEGTFWIDNPLVILDAPWVTDEHKAAGAKFRDFLLSKPMQELAMSEYGFRPSDPSIAIGEPISAAYGVDPQQPKTLLSTPEPAIIDHALEVWRETKKTVDIMFVFDRSGSMKGEALKQAKQGALDFLDLLDERDRVAMVMFNHQVPDKITDPKAVGANRDALKKQVSNTFADGGTALYDAISASFDHLERKAKRDPKRIFALVVLTDGVDESSRIQLNALRAKLAPSGEMGTLVRLFTIAYGGGADKDILDSIAEAGGGASFSGDPRTIRQVYRDLAAFF